MFFLLGKLENSFVFFFFKYISEEMHVCVVYVFECVANMDENNLFLTGFENGKM